MYLCNNRYYLINFHSLFPCSLDFYEPSLLPLIGYFNLLCCCRQNGHWETVIFYMRFSVSLFNLWFMLLTPASILWYQKCNVFQMLECENAFGQLWFLACWMGDFSPYLHLAQAQPIRPLWHLSPFFLTNVRVRF